MESSIPADAPKPRLCHMRKRADFNGYGFNLHAEKGKGGQFIGKVDDGSPAQLAGIREGDRIVEVNGTNIGSENHQQVVQRIKAVPDETTFLVVDTATDEYYKEKKIVIKSDMPNVEVIETPAMGTNGTEAAHKPRLCHMKIWSDFAGYGFNLHAEKGKSVQYIGKVDEDSPAEAAGLQEGDKIVEVNGFNVSSESHPEVVARIKSDPKQVTMLVVDQKADVYFQKEGVTPSSQMSSVVRITCPDSNPRSGAGVVDGTAAAAGKKETDAPTPKPRLCLVKSRQDGKGYGFNMQAEKGKLGQYIGKVDPGSPAEEAGLLSGDVIIEVNGVNVEKKSHKEVVEEIKSNPNQTTLLVIDKEGYQECILKGVTVSSSMVEQKSNTGVDKIPTENGEDVKTAVIYKNETNERTDQADENDNKKPDKTTLSLDMSSTSSATSSSAAPIESPKSPPVIIDGLEFAGSVEEARKKMNKKRNVKDNSMSIKAKHDLYQKL